MLTQIANLISSGTVDEHIDFAERFELQKQRVILVCDLVESVKLMEFDEEYAVQTWRSFVQTVRDSVVPSVGGRVVKSLGDGMMIECSTAHSAMVLAKSIHACADEINCGQEQARHLNLRIGVHQTSALADQHDLYGRGVNLAARIASLACQNETVVSAVIREQLVDSMDGDIEDLGDCYLKHVSEPIRAFRVHFGREHSRHLNPSASLDEFKTVIAVVPLVSRANTVEEFAIGELIADCVISQISRCPDFKVISRLSTTALRDRQHDRLALKNVLRAQYVLSGSYVVAGSKLLVIASLCSTEDGVVIWSDRLTVATDDLFEEKSELIFRVSHGLTAALQKRSEELAYTRPLPNLPGYSLMLGGIQLTHRNTKNEFLRAHAVFEHLAERFQRTPTLPAWLAKWHVLQAAQGWSEDPTSNAKKALALSSRALDLDPKSALALSIDGFVRADLHRDFIGAMQRYDDAIVQNPSESFAWIFKGLLHGYLGQSASAVRCMEIGIELSPIDPAMYFIDSLAASTFLSAGQLEKAIYFGKKSVLSNVNHVSSFRVLTIATMLSGKEDEAKQYASRALQLDPTFSVTKFLLRRSGGGFNDMSHEFARALRQAGIPQ
jgi:adenylate cyclase